MWGRLLLITVVFLASHGFAMAEQLMSDGLHTTKYENGKVSIEQNYKYGKRDGAFRKYDPQGNLVQERTFKNGMLLDDNGKPWNGPHKDYFEYSAWQENHYKDGLLDGVCRAIGFDGKVMFERKFSKGRVVAYRAVGANVPGPREWTPLK